MVFSWRFYSYLFDVNIVERNKRYLNGIEEGLSDLPFPNLGNEYMGTGESNPKWDKEEGK